MNPSYPDKVLPASARCNQLVVLMRCLHPALMGSLGKKEAGLR